MQDVELQFRFRVGTLIPQSSACIFTHFLHIFTSELQAEVEGNSTIMH